MLKLFADHCISNYIITELQAAGCQVLRLKEYIAPGSDDQIVINKARELSCILVSLNGDFSDIVTYPPADYQGIIALQINNHPETIPQLMARLQTYLIAHPDMEHYNRKLFVVEVHRIRVRT